LTRIKPVFSEVWRITATRNQWKKPKFPVSSFSEAAKAVALLIAVLAEPPLSRASPLPQVIGVDGQ
jgi:hypothetical protein